MSRLLVVLTASLALGGCVLEARLSGGFESFGPGRAPAHAAMVGHETLRDLTCPYGVDHEHRQVRYRKAPYWYDGRRTRGGPTSAASTSFSCRYEIELRR